MPMPRERMKPQDESPLRTVQRIGVLNDRMMTSYENMMKLTKTERWLFASVGVTCGISFTNMLHIFTPRHAVLITTLVIVLLALCQLVYMYRGMRRLQAGKKELDAMNEDFMKRYGLTNDED